MQENRLFNDAKLEFPMHLGISELIPREGATDTPNVCVIYAEATQNELPFRLVLEVPDVKFIEAIMGTLSEIAAKMSANPANRSYDGTSELESDEDLEKRNALSTYNQEPVSAEAAPSNPAPASGESE